MTPMQLIFLLVAGVTLVSAGLVVSSRKVMHAALWLILTLFGVAILFALLESGFFAVVQVVVYIGAIAILIIFAVMLTRQVMMDVGPQVNRNWPLVAIVAAAVCAGLVWMFSRWGQFTAQAAPSTPAMHDLAALGNALVSPAQYMIPFEAASVLLLAALVGAIFVASDRKGK